MAARSPMQLVIGIDIGGTNINAAAATLSIGGFLPCVVAAAHCPTPRADPARFYAAVTDLVRTLQASVGPHQGTILPLLAVAHPGRFLPDGTLARGTTPNLGTSDGQFDGVKPAEELARRLGWRVFAENDAIAQMRFGLQQLLNDPAIRPQLLNETVVYLGPGTGMGGGVARVSADGGVSIVTDGHLFDLHVPWKPEELLTAEELFTGPAIARLVAEANQRLASPIAPAKGGGLSRILQDPHADPLHRAEAQRIADLHGDILAVLIETIHAGRIVKIRIAHTPDGMLQRHVDEPDRCWPAADQYAVRGARRFLLGGWVGTDPALGGRIRERALETLARRGLAGVAIWQIPDGSADAGVLGAVMAIAEEQIHQLDIS